MSKIIKDGEMHCPMCNEPVKRLIPTDKDNYVDIKCENEYGVHYANSYAKFLTPKTGPDHKRFNNGVKI